MQTELTPIEKLLSSKVLDKTVFDIAISLKKSLIFQKNHNFPRIEEIRENFKIYKKTKKKDYFSSLWAYIAKLDISDSFPIIFGNSILEKYLLQKILIHSERKKVWMSFSGINQNKKIYKNYYQNLQIQKKTKKTQNFFSQIKKDIRRTYPKSPENTTKTKKMQNILQRYTKRNPKLGYIQGFNLIVKFLLEMDLGEEDVFWFLSNLIENILPKNFYEDLSFVKIDIEICLELLKKKNPDFFFFCEKNFLVLDFFLMEFFLTLFCCVDNLYLVSIVFDYLLIEGIIAIYRSLIILLSFFYREKKEKILLGNFRKNFLDFLNNFGSYKNFKSFLNRFYINRKIVLKLREIFLKEKLGFLLENEKDDKIILISEDFLDNLDFCYFNPIEQESFVGNCGSEIARSSFRKSEFVRKTFGDLGFKSFRNLEKSVNFKNRKSFKNSILEKITKIDKNKKNMKTSINLKNRNYSKNFIIEKNESDLKDSIIDKDKKNGTKSKIDQNRKNSIDLKMKNGFASSEIGEKNLFNLSKSTIFFKKNESNIFQFDGNLQNQEEIQNKNKKNQKLKKTFFKNSKIITNSCYKKKSQKKPKIFINNNSYYLKEINISKSYLKAPKFHRSESFEKLGKKKNKRVFSKSLDLGKNLFLEDFLNISLFSNHYQK